MARVGAMLSTGSTIKEQSNGHGWSTLNGAASRSRNDRMTKRWVSLVSSSEPDCQKYHPQKRGNQFSAYRREEVAVSLVSLNEETKGENFEKV
uniref:Uncharacterized protein n=1 Tax=Anopheles albimanus TaxID=7167 RepID=A0A182FS21_ANOAL